MAEKTSLGALPGLESETTMSAAESGISPSRRQPVASFSFLPAERSLAPSHVNLNQGCPCRNRMNCCPTMPVPPRTPTSIGFAKYACAFIFCLIRGHSPPKFLDQPPVQPH